MDPIEAARKRRRELHAVLVEVERAIARPAPGRSEQWMQRVRDALERLRDAFEEHVRGTEEPRGLYDHILAAAPRLQAAVRQLREEHVGIAESVDDAAELLDHAAGADPSDQVETVREAVLSLIARLSRHRQRGSDLVYEAFELDIGAVD